MMEAGIHQSMTGIVFGSPPPRYPTFSVFHKRDDIPVMFVIELSGGGIYSYPSATRL